MNIASQFEGRTFDVLQLVLEQSLDCIQLVSASGELEYVNPAGRADLEIDDAGGPADCEWAALWSGDSRIRALAALDQARAGKKARFDAERSMPSGGVRGWMVSVSPITDDAGEVGHFLVIARLHADAADGVGGGVESWREVTRHARHSDDVAREMRHRFKNQLAVVSAVMKLLARHTDDPLELAQKFDGKLSALGRAQDLLSIAHERPLTAKEAIEEVLQASGAGDQIKIGALPDACLADESVQNLALILGELQTNSLKYGALADEGGPITLSGENAEGAVKLVWEEDCGRAVDKPTSHGAGTKLIERLGSTSKHRAKFTWQANGPRIEFYIRSLG